MDRRQEDLLRDAAPQVLTVLVRRYGHFDACEDAVQEALLAATAQWGRDGEPESPRSWLLTVASRRLIDQLRSESARRRREDGVAALEPDERHVAPPADEAVAVHDDTLTLLFLCCHPALTPGSQLALTLRAVGGLTTAEIAAALLVPETTLAQRISRAKQRIRDAGARFVAPAARERDDRLTVVLQVLYLIFNEGYTARSGERLHRPELTAEAIRITRLVHDLVPDDGEVAGLLALMLLTDARSDARVDANGLLVPIPEQDRARWDAAAIAAGVELVSRALATTRLGPYQVQAAIAAVHCESPSADATDWAQIVALYDVLAALAPNPMVTVNQAVAVAMVRGPLAGLGVLAGVADDPRLAGQRHRVESVRAHLLELAGDVDGARTAYRSAARRTTSLPEQRHLLARAARLGP